MNWHMIAGSYRSFPLRQNPLELRASPRVARRKMVARAAPERRSLHPATHQLKDQAQGRQWPLRLAISPDMILLGD